VCVFAGVQIYRVAGYPTVDKKKGRLEYSEYELAPRAMIFRRDQVMNRKLSRDRYSLMRPLQHTTGREVDDMI
jgi:hypothetical protein